MNLKCFIKACFILIFFFVGVSYADQCKLDGINELTTSPPFDSYGGGDVEVDLLPIFLKIGPIDGENYQYYADFYLNSYWYDENLADKIFETSDREWCQLEGASVIDKIWTPGIEFINLIEMQESLLNKIYISVDGTIHQEQRIQGMFASDLDFSIFPFDRQTLKITTMPFNPGSVVLRGIEPAEEWTEKLKFRDWLLIKTKGFNSSVDYLGETFPTYDFQLFLKRIPNFYIVKVLAPVFIMVLLVLCSFFINPADFDARLGVTVTLLLTIVAYTFIAGENLPVLSYLTFTDAYLVISFFFCVISVLATIIYRLITGVEYDDDDQITLKMHRSSKIFGIALLFAYIAIVIALYIFSIS